jgi:CubicO group peptidase (beta-lactamase class C family)
MKRRSKWFWILLTLGGVGGLLVLGVIGVIVWVYRDLTSINRQSDTHDLRQRVEQRATPYLAKRPQGALVAGVVRGGQVHWLGFGRVSAANTNVPDADTLFEIGSVTKVFTGIALARMGNEGKLKLDDPIGKLLPPEVALPAELQPITLRQLATHTAGLPRLPGNLDLSATHAANPYAGYTSKELYDCLRTAKLESPPGKKSEYSNLGVGLLGHLLELKAGIAYERLLREQILDPLGLTNTAITLTPAQQLRLTPGHDAEGNVVSNWDFAVLAPAGALRSSATDLLAFLQANLATNATTLNLSLALAQQTQYESWLGNLGLCWQILEAPGIYRFHWHNGGTGGYVSFIGLDRAHSTGVVLLSNYGDAMADDDSLDEMGMELLKLAAKVSWE